MVVIIFLSIVFSYNAKSGSYQLDWADNFLLDQVEAHGQQGDAKEQIQGAQRDTHLKQKFL